MSSSRRDRPSDLHTNLHPKVHIASFFLPFLCIFFLPKSTPVFPVRIWMAITLSRPLCFPLRIWIAITLLNSTGATAPEPQHRSISIPAPARVATRSLERDGSGAVCFNPPRARERPSLYSENKYIKSFQFAHPRAGATRRGKTPQGKRTDTALISTPASLIGVIKLIRYDRAQWQAVSKSQFISAAAENNSGSVRLMS